MSIEQKIQSLGLTLPAASKPVAAYIPTRRTGNLVFVAGQIPMRDGQLVASGPVPSKVSVEQAKDAARQCVLNGLAALKAEIGSLDKMRQVVRVGVFVCSDNSFTDQPTVANGASELLEAIFGPPGQHARAAVGVNTLPRGAAVEVEFIFEVE